MRLNRLRMDTEGLHWSFDHSYHHNGSNNDFKSLIYKSLAEYTQNFESNKTNNHCTHEYVILPNFWSGYMNDSPSLAIGGLKIKAKTSKSDINYHVMYENRTTGETTKLNFDCSAYGIPEIKNSWEIFCKSKTNDIYSSIDMTGQIVKSNSKTNIQLKLSSGVKFSAGTKSGENPIICNWALPNLLSKIHNKQLISSTFDVLENMENLYNDCVFKSLESTEIQLNDNSIVLNGYCLYGTGKEPSYWWLDDNNNVAIISTTFSTYVLRKVSFKEDVI